MALKSRILDMTTAYVGMTLKHVASGKAYTVTEVTPPTGESDYALTIKNAHGGTAFVGTDMIDPDEFVSLHTM